MDRCTGHIDIYDRQFLGNWRQHSFICDTQEMIVLSEGPNKQFHWLLVIFGSDVNEYEKYRFLSGFVYLVNGYFQKR